MNSGFPGSELGAKPGPPSTTNTGVRGFFLRSVWRNTTKLRRICREAGVPRSSGTFTEPQRASG
jgi:hypothetical protein